MAGNLSDLQKLLIRASKEIPDKALRAIGVEGKKFIEKNFRDQGFTDTTTTKWEERKHETSESRAILVGFNTGGDKLKNSFKYRVSKGTNTVVFRTYKAYAAIHNEGGRITGTFNVRSHNRKTRTKRTVVQSHSRRVNTTIPKRQFIGKSAYLNRQIADKIKRELDLTLR